MKTFSVAYIGCGAVVEKSHLPAIRSVNYLEPSVLIDTNIEQRKRLANEYEISIHANDIDEVINDFQIAVIATPSATHFSITKKLLLAGKHVLVEKPLSLKLSEAKTLIELATTQQVALSVGLVRRYLPSYRMLKSLLENNVIGNIDDFLVEEGGVFNWPVQSEGFFDAQSSGGGVLVDTGSHLLDACLWWFGDYQSVDYYDDNQGGVEAECCLNIKLKSGANGKILMSRLRNLSNRVVINGSKGTITLDLITGETKLQLQNSSSVLLGDALDSDVGHKPSTQRLFEQQYIDLYQSIINQKSRDDCYLALAKECLPSIRLMEECSNNRRLMSTLVS